jgi:transcriptional regulator with XRE-family HTH domain
VAPRKRPFRQRLRTYFREWREFSNPDFSQAARRVGRDHLSLQRLEAGKIPYSQDMLELLADLYGCKPWDLISRHPISARGMRSDVVSDYESSPPEIQQQVMDAARAIRAAREAEGRKRADMSLRFFRRVRIVPGLRVNRSCYDSRQ